MNKPVRAADLANSCSGKSVDELLRSFKSELSYRTLEPRMAFDGAAVAAAVATVEAAAAQKTPEPAASSAEPVADSKAAVAAPVESQPVPFGVRSDVGGVAAKADAVAFSVDASSNGLLAAAIAIPAGRTGDAHPAIVFIDQNVENISQIVSSIDPHAEIVLINDLSSGLDQIAAHLAGRTDIGSIQIVSHGETGTLYLGTDTLTASTLADHDAALATIGRSLTDSGDILLYGCDIASGSGGMDLVRSIADKTGADVAASINKTGGIEAGGDWVLEATSGAIEAKTLNDPLYAGVLAKTNTGVWTIAGLTASNTTDGVTTTVTFANAGTSTWTAPFNDTLNNAAGGVTATTFDNGSAGGASLSTIWNSTNTTDVGTVTITFSTAVTNPVLNLDRLGGTAGTSNSSLWTVTTPGATLTKLSGVTHFLVDSTLGTITEQLGQASVGGQSNSNIANGSSAGSVRINGTFTTITFSVKMNPGAGAGIGDGTELAFVIDAPPVAVADTFATTKGVAVTINAVANDTDVRGDTLAVTKINGTSVIPSGPGVAVTGGTVILDASGKIVFTPTAGYTGAPSFNYTIADANGGSSVATISGTVTDIAPALDLDASGAGTGWTTTFKENGTAVAISDIDAVVTDADDANMASGSIVLTNKQTGDRLSIGGTPVTNGTTGTINGLTYTVIDTGTSVSIALSGSATKTVYASTLQAITFDNTTETPSTTPRTINITVNDGALNSNTAVATINVDAAPDPVNDSVSGNEDSAISGNVLTNDVDLGTTPITSVTVAANPANGTLTSFNTATGAFVYTPASNFNGTDTFTYRVTDANGDVKDATVTITVNPINDAPVNTVPGAQTTAEDTALKITGVSVNDVDGASVTLVTTLTIPAGSGILNIASSAGVSVSGDGTATVTIKGTAAGINAAIAAINYTPLADYNTGSPATQIALTVSTSDGVAPAVSSTISITVTPVADIADDSITTNEDTAVTFAPFANDTFENSVHTITAINGTAIVAGGAGVIVTGGAVKLDAAGNLTYTPNANYNGAPSFTYTVSSGGVSETATVNITVVSINDAPVNTLPGAQVTPEDVTKIITGVSVADADAATLTTTLTIPAGAGLLNVVTGGGAAIGGNGTTTVTISGTAAQVNAAVASITYTPTADYNTGSPASPINLTVATSDGTATTTGTIAVTVSPVADIVNDTIAATEDTASSFNVMTGTGGAAADNFENSGAAVTSVTQPANGSVSFAANGAITYTPSANFSGTDTFTYTVSLGGVTETATVTINVASVNDAPVNVVPGAQTTTEDTSVVFRASNGNAITVADVDSNVTTTLTIANGKLTLGSITGVTVTGNGTGTVTVSGSPASVTAALAGLSFAPTADWNGATTLNVSTSDGVAPAVVSTIGITVSPVFDITPDSITTAEDTARTFNVLTNDSFENAGATVSSVVQPSHGTVSIGSGGNVTYTPASNYNGPDSFTYTVTSGGVTETTTVTVTLTAVNDAPTASTPFARTSIDGAVATYNIGGFYSDVDGDTLTFSATGMPPGLTIDSVTGKISGTIDIHASTGGTGGVYAVSVKATDPSGAFVTRTFNWTVTNPAPVAGNDTFTGSEDTAISGNVLLNDSDPDGDALSIVTTPVTGPAHGTLVLNSNGTFTYMPAANYNGLDSFSYTLKDADGATTAATVTLNVNPVNDSPVITAPAALSATEDTPLTFGGANTITVSDVDSSSLTTTLAVTNGKLTLSSATGVTITGSGTGTLRLVGSPADVTAAIAAMTYNAPADYNGPATLTVSSTDGIGTNSSSIALTVAPVADITPDSVSTNEDNAISFNVLTGTNGATADNFESASAAVTSITQGARGTVTIGAGGLLTYTPNADYNGTDTFTYTVTSGGVTETATVTVTVNAVNDIPTQALPAAQLGTEDVAVIFSGAKGNQIVIGDIDSASITTTVSVPSGSLTAIATPGVAILGNGTGIVTLTGDSAAITAALNGLTYVPVADANGTVTMSVSTTDGGIGSPVSGTVDITLAPVADIANDSATTTEDAAKSISVLGNDTFENPGRTVTAVTNGANGSVAINGDGTVTYTPNPNFNGTDSFTYTVTSGGVTETATVSVVVTAVNDAPTQIVPAAQTTSEDTGLTFSTATGNAISVADVDGDILTTTVSVTNGTIDLGAFAGVSVTGNGTGSVKIVGSVAAINAALDGMQFNPTADYNGSAVITIATSDGALTASSTVPLTVTSVADITDDIIVTAEDTAITVNVMSNDTFENSGATLTSVTQGAHGTVVISAGGNITYTPASNYNGPDSFTYTVTSGGVTETATVTVDVTSVNDLPIVTVPPGQSTNEDTPLVFSSANGNVISVSDADGDTLTVTLSAANGLLTLGSTSGVTFSGNGTAALTVTGSAAAVTAALNGLTFASTPDYNGSAALSVTTTDSTVTVSNTIAINVNPVADIAADVISTNEDTAVTFNVLSNDSFEATTASVLGVTQGGSGSVSFLADGTIVYTPDANFHGTDTFTYTVTSGGVAETTTVTVNIASINDAPTTTGLADHINLDGQSISFNAGAAFADVDTVDTLTFSAAGLPPGLTINSATGIISGTIDRNASQTGPYTVAVTAIDGNGGTVSANFTWSVSNPGPSAHDDAATIDEDTPATINVLSNDTDPDQDPLTVTSATAGNGSVVINPDGTIKYTPNTNFNGTDTIVYQISDGNGGLSTATVNVTIKPVNDAPATSGLANLLDNDSSPVNIDVSGAFSDLDGDTLTYAISGLPPGLTYDPATGIISGTLAANASAPTGDHGYPITVIATDPSGATVSTVFTWRVLNLPPTGTDDFVTTPEDTAVVAAVLSNDHDPDNDPLTITEINGHPIALGGLVATANGQVQLLTDSFGQQVLVFTPNPDFNGVETLVYKSTDGNAGFDTATLTITVVPQNDAPTADNLANLSSKDSDLVSVPLGPFFHDIDFMDGDTLQFDAAGLPPGLSIDSATGTISGTIDHSASVGGPYTVVITATDSAGAKVSQTFTWDVVNPKPTAADEAKTLAQGDAVNASAAMGVLSNDTDPDLDPLVVDAINGSAAGVGQPVAGSSGGIFVIYGDGSYTFDQNHAFDNIQTGHSAVTIVTYRLSDGDGGYSTATLTITVTGVNDAPVATSIPDQTTLDSAPLVLNAAAAFSDVDGDALEYSAVNLPAGLAIDPVTGVISGTIDHSASQVAGGVYTVTVYADDKQGGITPVVFKITIINPAPVGGDDVAATDEDTPLAASVAGNDSDPDGDPLTFATASGPAHGSVTMASNGNYTYTPAANFHGSDSFTYTVTDSDGASKTQSVTITVNSINDTPDSTPVATQSSNDGTTVALDVSGNFSDVDGDALSFAVDPAHPLPPGLSINPVTGVISGTIDHLASASGPYTVTITATDPGGETVSQTFTWNVANPAPVGTPIADAADIDAALVSIAAGTGFSDPDGDTLSFSASGMPAGLTIDAATGLIHGTLGSGASAGGPSSDGIYAVTVTATDNQGATVSKTFAYTVTNPAPSAGNDSFSGNEDSSITGSVTANDQDPDGDAVSYALVTSPAHGTIVFNSNGTFTYSPAANYNGSDVFTYKIIDSQGKEAVATVVLTIAGVNDAPGPVAASIVTDEDTPLSGTLPATDIDGDTVTFTVNTAPSHGTVTVSAAGAYTYTPAANYNGPDSFVVELDDGNGGTTLQTISVTVNPVNDAPVAVDDSYTTNEDTALTATLAMGVIKNDTDVETDSLSATLVSGPAHGTLTFNADGTFTYTPDVNYNGPDSFTYKVNDGADDSNVATVNLTVTAVNDAPVATDGSYPVTEDTPVSGNVLTDDTGNGVDSDIDSPTLTVTQFKVGTTTYAAGTIAHLTQGDLVIGTDGSFTFTPKANYNGAVPAAIYTVSDGTLTDTGTLTLGPVSAVNDVPAVLSETRTVVEDTTATGNVLSNDSDVEGDTLKVSQFAVGGTSYAPGTTVHLAEGDLTITATGAYTFVPTLNYNGPVPIATYTVDDGHGGATDGTLKLTVSPTNDPPVAGTDTVPVTEDMPVSGNVLGNDTDAEGDTLFVTKFVVGGTSYSAGTTAHMAEGDLVINGDGTFTFAPAANYNGPVPVATYTITDGNSNVDGLLQLGPITPVNDGPVAVNDSVTGDEDTPLAGNVLANDTDVDGDTLAVTDADGNPANGVTPVVGPVHGTLVLNANGTFTYTPDANYNGSDSFTYRVSDGHGGFAEAVVSLNVKPVNDAPTDSNGTAATLEDKPFTGTLPIGSDADGNALTYAKASDPSHGAVVVNANGTYTYKPNPNFNGADSFTYTVSDGHGGANTYTVTVVVAAVNDAPVIKPVTAPVSADRSKVTFDLSKFTSDIDGGKLKYTTTGLPPGLKIDSATGLVTGTITHDASQAGPYTVTLTVDDGHGGIVSKTFTWPVTNPAPHATNDQASVNTGKDVTVNVLANDTDPDGDPLTVTKAKAGNGTVEILPDGSIKYTPKAGFVGTDTITYVVSDGNGGFAIASVTIAVSDAGYAEKPVIFGFDGPEHTNNQQLAAHDFPHEGITAEGAVTDAVFSFGELRSVAAQLGVGGVVMSAANGVRSLNGVGSLTTSDPIADTIDAARANDILTNAGFDRGFQEYRIDGLPGFSFRNNVPGNLGGLGPREQILIESLVRNNTLIVQITNSIEPGSKRIVDYRLTQPDGTPLPDWMDRAGKDLLIGRRAANLDQLQLRIEAVYSDSTVVIEEVKIDTATGEIQPLKVGRKGALAPRLFGDQFHAPAMLSPDQIRTLGRAIAR